MGKYSDISVANQLTAAIGKIQKSSEKNEKKLKESLDAYTKRCTALGAIDQNNYKSDVAFWLQVNNVVTAGMSFIPLAGPVWAAAIGPIVNATVAAMINSGEKNTLGAMKQGAAYGLLAAAKFSYSNRDKQTFNIGSVTGFPPLPAGSSNTPQQVFTQSVGSSAITSTVSSFTGLVAVPLGIYFKKPSTGKSSAPVPVTKDTLGLELKNYVSALEDGYAWVADLDKSDEWGKNLIYLFFYTYLSGQAAGGRGASLIDSGVAFNNSIRDGRAQMYSLSELTQKLETTAKLGSTLHKDSRLITQLKKYKITGVAPASYTNLFSDFDGSDEAARNDLISTITLEKARIIAYVDDYARTMKAFFGNVFVASITAPLAAKRVLPEAFKESGHGLPNVYQKSTGVLGVDRSEHRKDWAIGIYAFHAMLQRHLGTYNLSGLPAFGLVEDMDRRVHHALIDAVLTQWWITSQAYGSIKIGNTLSNSAEVFEQNLNSVKLIDAPYIKFYFDPERVWRQIGRQVHLDCFGMKNLSNAYSENKTKIDAQLKSAIDSAGEIDAFGKVKPKISDLNSALKDKIKNVYSFSNIVTKVGVIKLTDEFLLGLMPTNKQGTGISNAISKYLSSCYKGLNDFTDIQVEEALKKGWEDSEKNKLSPGSYKDSLEEAYKRATNKPDDDVSAKYADLLATTPGQWKQNAFEGFAFAGEDPLLNFMFADEEEIQGYRDSASSSLEEHKAKLQGALAKELGKIHMGAIASAAADSGFEQADFNRAMARAMKLLIQHITLKE
jgi:hypothetical protein